MAAYASITSSSKLFTPIQLGTIGKLSHRVILAPLTRNRATEPDLCASELTAQYYRQRATTGGLLITEATNISPESLAYPSTPGIWSTEQTQAWKKVVQAVHQQGGYLVCQLWHTGRVAHPSYGNHPSNFDSGVYKPCVSASPTPILNRHGKPGKTLTYNGVANHEVPRELSQADILRLREDYKKAASNAKAAGFDGIEIHSAHGYLLDQFLNNGVNRRQDNYGGSISNRCRLLLEVLESVLEIWPASKIGIRLSPHDSPNGGNTYYGCTDSNPDALYTYAIQQLNQYNLAYLLLTEPRWIGKYDNNHETDPGYQMPCMNLEKYRSLFTTGLLIGAGGFTPTTSYQVMSAGNNSSYDALAFGRWFISNPDLPAKLQSYHEYLQYQQEEKSNGKTTTTTMRMKPPPKLNRYERDTFYTQDAEGYVDYPSLEFLKQQQQTNGTSSSNKNNSKFQGMRANKYDLVDQGHVGTTLKQTATAKAKSQQQQPRSKL